MIKTVLGKLRRKLLLRKIDKALYRYNEQHKEERMRELQALAADCTFDWLIDGGK